MLLHAIVKRMARHAIKREPAVMLLVNAIISLQTTVAEESCLSSLCTVMLCKDATVSLSVHSVRVLSGAARVDWQNGNHDRSEEKE